MEWRARDRVDPALAAIELARAIAQADEFREALFPPKLAADFEHTGGLTFSVDRSIDRSKTLQTGVYETCDGRCGSFLLILARPLGKPPAIRFMHEFRALPFGMLVVRPAATIIVFHCMECDHLDKLAWSQTKKRLVPLKSIDE